MKFEAFEEIRPEIEGDAPIKLHMDDEGIWFSEERRQSPTLTYKQFAAAVHAVEDFKMRTQK